MTLFPTHCQIKILLTKLYCNFLSYVILTRKLRHKSADSSVSGVMFSLLRPMVPIYVFSGSSINYRQNIKQYLNKTNPSSGRYSYTNTSNKFIIMFKNILYKMYVYLYHSLILGLLNLTYLISLTASLCSS
jgi:hypothetical protein